jgi:hypothetical protein
MGYMQTHWAGYRGRISQLSGKPPQQTVPQSLAGLRCSVRPSESTCHFDMAVRFEDGSVQTFPLFCHLQRDRQGRLVPRPEVI